MSGVASRRQADKLISEGHIRINGKKMTTLGYQVDPLKDEVFCDKKQVKLEKHFFYFSFYKPKKVLSTLSDPEGRPTLFDFISHIPIRLFPIGRLDWESEGLILLTNDGEFSQKVIHPKYKIPKTYMVKVRGHIHRNALWKLERGVTLSGKKARVLKVQKVKYEDSIRNDWVKVVISEGRNQQIRRMFEKVDFHVLKLKRVSIGDLRLGKLKPGKLKTLSRKDIQKIFFQKKGFRKNKISNHKNLIKIRKS